MDFEEKITANTWTNSSSRNEFGEKPSRSPQTFSTISFQHDQQKWEDPSILDFNTRIESGFTEFKQAFELPPTIACNPNDQTQIPNQQDGLTNEARSESKLQDWDPRTMLSNLSFLEQKIHQLQDLVHLIVSRRGQVVGPVDEIVAQQQQLITADLTSIIVQLISTAGSLLPAVKNSLLPVNLSVSQLGQLNGGLVCTTEIAPSGSVHPQNNSRSNISDQSNHVDLISNFRTEHEEHESKDEEDADDGENLPPGSYEILQLEKEEILAPHTHFCTICGKGFKRDANLRMHMRGHGDEYKSPAALAKPHKEPNSEATLIKRYSCPYSGCKRNRDHKKFQPLKTILCVKNHYKRTHCDKSFICSRCNTKKFSVIADLKTHEKHCGRDKWLCSCGTTFSRKDKLFGHIALFQGHTPAIPLEEIKGSEVGPSSEEREINDAMMVESTGVNLGSDVPCGSGFRNDENEKGSIDDPTSYFSPLNFDTCNLSGFHEFPRPVFEDSESSFSFLISGSRNYQSNKTGRESASNDL